MRSRVSNHHWISYPGCLMSAEDIVREMHAEGQEKWPSIAIAFEIFKRYCERICDDDQSAAKIRNSAADVYLSCACVNGDLGALSIFKREAEGVVRGAIARVHRDPEFIRETLQEFWKKLLAGPDARVHEYRGRGPLQAWLRICAARLAIDRYRAERAVTERETDLGDCLAEQAFGPESTLTRTRFREPFRLALQHAITSMTTKDRNLLRMHVVGRCSIDQIGRAYNVHRATAARWLEQARERILRDVRTELDVAGPPLTDSEFRSVARIMGGELELENALFQSQLSVHTPSSPR
jgi:RNA polymerase sigma-70 factor, ECF subfamily